MFVGQTFVLAVQVANLSSTNANIACRNVRAWTEVATELRHEGLAEAAHFRIRLALWIKVGASLASTHRQSGKSVFEYLLEAEEFEDALIHTWMEAQSSLVGTQNTAAVTINTRK